MAQPDRNRNGQRPYHSTAVKPPTTINASLANAPGFHSIDNGNNGIPQSGVLDGSSERVPFVNGKPPVAQQPASAGVRVAAHKQSPLLQPQYNKDTGTLESGIHPQTGEAIKVVNGRMIGDGKPNPDLVQKIRAQEAQTQATNKAVATPATPAGTVAAPTIPSNPGLPHNVAVDQRRIEQAFGNQPPPATVAAPPVPAHNAAGYITDAGAQDAANRAGTPNTSGVLRYGKIGQTTPDLNAYPAINPHQQGTTALPNGGFVTVGAVDPNGPAGGGSGIVANGIAQEKDANGVFRPAVSGPPTATPTARDVTATAGLSAPPAPVAPASTAPVLPTFNPTIAAPSLALNTGASAPAVRPLGDLSTGFKPQTLTSSVDSPSIAPAIPTAFNPTIAPTPVQPVVAPAPTGQPAPTTANDVGNSARQAISGFGSSILNSVGNAAGAVNQGVISAVDAARGFIGQGPSSTVQTTVPAPAIPTFAAHPNVPQATPGPAPTPLQTPPPVQQPSPAVAAATPAPNALYRSPAPSGSPGAAGDGVNYAAQANPALALAMNPAGVAGARPRQPALASYVPPPDDDEVRRRLNGGN